jgi:G:T/U-mismatch repair DNA glycosylase
VEYGEGKWKGARVFVASSTSGLAATLSLEEKERIWRELGEWVENRREETRVKEEGT